MSDPSQKLIQEGFIKNHRTDGDIFSSGDFYQVSLVNGKKHGTYLAVDNKGVRHVTGEYSQDVKVGHWTLYWPDGFQSRHAGEFEKNGSGKKTGLWNTNEQGGRNTSHGHYEDDKKIGKWILDGQVYSPVFYIEDEEVSEKEWDKYQRRKQKQTFNENKNTDGKSLFCSLLNKIGLKFN